MGNEVRITVTGENKASPALRAVADDSVRAKRSVKELAESTDQLDESGGHATSSLGALGSGFELIGKTNVQDKLNQVALATDFMSGVGEGATLVMDKFGGALGKLKHPGELAKGALSKVKEGFTDVTSTAGKVTTGLIGATAAVAALAAIGATLNYVLKDKVNVSMHDTVQGLQQIASTGKVTSDALKGLSSNTDLMKHDLESLNGGFTQHLKNLGDYSGAVGEMVGADALFEESSNNTEKRLKAIDDALVQMVSDGQTVSAAQAFSQLAEEAAKSGVSVKELQGGLPGYTEAAKNATVTTDTAAEAFESEADALARVSNSLKAQTDPLFAVYDAQDQVTQATEDYNKALKEHGSRSKEARSANINLDKAIINMASTLGAAASGTGHLTNEQKHLLSSAGTSKARIKELDTALYNAWKQAQHLDGFRADITVATTYKNYGAPSQRAYGTGRASGGVIGAAATGGARGGLTKVGENGPELVDLPAGSTVHSAGDSARMEQASGGGETTVVLRFDPAGAPGLVSELLKAMRMEIRSQGGNVQRVLGVVGA